MFMSTLSPKIHLPSSSSMILAGLGILSIAVVAATAMFVMPLHLALSFVILLAGGAVFLIVPERRRLVLGLLVFVIPLNIDVNFIEQASPGGADGLSFGLVEILMLLLLGLTAVRSTQFKQVGTLKFYPALLLPSLAMLSFFLISTINARDLWWSVFDIANFIKVIIFYLLIANNIQNDTDMRVALIALFGGVMTQAGIATAINLNPAIADLFLRLKLGVAGDIADLAAANQFVRSGGSLGNANHLGRYLGLVLPIAFMMFVTRQNRILSIVAAGAALFGGVALINTLSRSAWIGLIFSILVMLPLMLQYRLVSFRTIWLFGLATLGFAVLLFVFGDVIWQRFAEDDQGSAMTRITTAKVAWAIIKDHAFFGCGINNYGAMLAEYWIGEDTFTNKAAVHNNYLLYMAEIGIIGFTAVIWWLVAFALRLGKAIRSKSSFFVAIAIGIMGGFAGMLLESLTDKSYKENFSLLLLLWTLMAITEAIIRLNGEQNNDHRAVVA
jgi:O-antigen ligase